MENIVLKIKDLFKL